MAENIINKKRESKNDFERLRKLIANPRKYAPIFLHKMAPLIKDDETYLRLMWRIKFDKPLNLTNPQTFNEKLQWLKLHDHNPEYTRMVDKYEAKKYVAEKIGEEYIIPTLGVWDHFDDIDFDSLPNQFVLKCTHDSGGVVICKDKNNFDFKTARSKIKRRYRSNYYYIGREWPYKNVKPRIIAEKYMEEKGEGELKDYKIFNFGGEAKIIQVDYNRFVEHMRNLYSTNWEYIEAKINYPNNPNHKIAKPEKLEEMLELARRLSKNFPFLRTDFYSIDDKLYFGELTFFPEAGFCKFNPESYGVELGNYINLPWGGVILKCKGYVLWIHEKKEVGLKDYKLHCFNGEPKFTLVCSDRYADGGLCEDFFDNDWGHLPIRRPSHPNAPHDIACPENFELMKRLARQLSADIPFVRVDFYEIDGKVYFGEITFFPASGMEAFVPNDWDVILGGWITLNQ